jgi:P4 family phage/plasmid primase-like protien
LAITKPFQELLERLGRTEEDSVAICYQSATQGFRVKKTKVQHADMVVEALNDLNANVWYEINPANAEFRARSEDITRLAAVWIDIDYKQGGVQDEKNAKELINLLSDLIGVSPTAVVHSGHGLQPYWAIDPEEELTPEQSTGLIQRWGAFVRWLAASQGGQIDSVFDLPRIFRAPGSVNHKDVANPVQVRVDFPDQWRPLAYDELDDILIAHGFASVVTMPQEFDKLSEHNDWEFAHQDCHWVGNLFSSVKPSNGVPKSRHGWLLQQLVKINAAHRNGCISESSADLLLEILTERFRFFLTQNPSRQINQGEIAAANKWAVAKVETMSPQKLKEELRNHEHKDLFLGSPEDALSEPVADGNYDDEELAQIYKNSYGTYGKTDAANARRLVYFMRGDYKHVTDVGWHRWDNTRYVLDKEKTIMQTAIDAAEFVQETSPPPDQMKWAEASTNRDRIQNAIIIAGTDNEVLVHTIELDAEANNLCTPAGIVNLQTGEIREALKSIDLNTRQTTVAPRNVPTPLWDEFLREVIEDEDRIRYLQELFGATLFGDSRYHVLPVLVGTGANGKSTMLDVVSGILGDYSASMPENFLLDTNGNAHPTEIARLRGVRFAVASETRPDGKFNESRVKMLTGGDMLSARFMNQNFFDFKPTHTLFLAVNHLPEVKSGGDGFWRRLRKFDFRKTVPVEKRKENLAQTLIEQEGPGILQWMVDGAVRITNQGISEPESIRMATQSYRHEEDHIAKFLDEKVIVSDASSVTKTAVFNAYRDWCSDNGEKPISQNSFARELRSRLGIFESESVGYKMFVGIELLKIDSMSNGASVNDMMGASDGDSDKYWR